MKRKTVLRTVAAFGLSLLVALSAFAAAFAQDAEAELENGITWKTTIPLMKNAEGLAEDSEMDTYSVGDFTQYGTSRPAEGDNPESFVYYIFKLDQLVMFGNSFDSYALPEDTDMTAVFGSQLARLSERYGEPTIDDRQRFVGLMDMLEEGAVSDEDIEQFAGWDLGNGTELYLMNVFGDSVLYVFANTARLLVE